MLKKLSLLFLSLSLICSLSNNSFAQDKKKKNKDKDSIESKYDLKYPVKIPKFEIRHLDLGDKYFNKGDYQKAYDEYYLSTRLNPMFWQGFRGIGNVFVKIGKLSKAIENYMKAVNIVNPTYAASTLDEALIAIKENDLYLGIAKLQKILAIEPAAGILVDEGVKLIQENKKSKAIEKFQEAIKIDKDYADAYFKLGNLLYEKKSYPEALKNYEFAVQYDPSEYAYHYALGNAYYKQAYKNKKSIDYTLLKKAIKSYEKAYNFNQRDMDVLFNYGTALVDQSLFIKSKIDEKEQLAIKKAGEKDPEFPPEIDSMKKESISYSKKASILLEKVTAFNPLDVNSHIYLGNAYMNIGELPYHYIKAVEEYQKAIEIDGSQTPLYFNIAVAYYLASKLNPRSEDLPITRQNSKQYIRFGKKFYRGDMLTYAQEYFNSYLLYNLRDKNVSNARKYLATVTEEIANLGFRVPDRRTGR
ncbi:MAG: hypothetical protein KatS3mg068_0122 [Candidatus Sericytochromatia bacterium]|nr:MAG: hypothetical protein KatS3mg068_0122 [Candidatus Sericytochromatia bacterium]